MKRKLCFFTCLLVLFLLVGCHSDDTLLRSGNYYAVGDYEEMLTPYLYLDTSKNEFVFGAGSVVSFAEYGEYEVVDRKIIATSQSTIYHFEIKDRNTISLIENGDPACFKIPVGTQFVFSKDLK